MKNSTISILLLGAAAYMMEDKKLSTGLVIASGAVLLLPEGKKPSPTVAAAEPVSGYVSTGSCCASCAQTGGSCGG